VYQQRKPALRYPVDDLLPQLRATVAAVRAQRAQDAVALRAAVDRMHPRTGLVAAWTAIDSLLEAIADERGTSWDEEADRVTGMLACEHHPATATSVRRGAVSM